jgi:phage head maturation protease
MFECYLSFKINIQTSQTVTDQVNSGEVSQISVGLEIVQEFCQKSSNVVHVVPRCDVVDPEIICMHELPLDISSVSLKTYVFAPIDQSTTLENYQKSIQFLIQSNLSYTTLTS